MRIVQTSCIIRIEPNTSTRSMLIAYSSLTDLLMRHAGSRFVVYFCILKKKLKKIIFFLFLINIFLVFLDHFDVLISKIFF